MSKLLLKTEVWLVDDTGQIAVKLAESQNVFEEGDSMNTGNNFLYKGDDDGMLAGQYVTELKITKY